MENQQQEKDVWGHRAGYYTFYHFRAHERRLCLLHSCGFDCYSKGHGDGWTTSLTPVEMNVHGVHTCFLKEVSDIWGWKKNSAVVHSRKVGRRSSVHKAFLELIRLNFVFTVSPLFLSVISQPPEWTQAAQRTKRNDGWAIVVSISYKKEVDEGYRWLKAPLRPFVFYTTFCYYTTFLLSPCAGH